MLQARSTDLSYGWILIVTHNRQSAAFRTKLVAQDDVLALQGGWRGFVQRDPMKVDGVVAHDAGESYAPLGAVGAVGGVQQTTFGHDFVVDSS